MVVSNKQWQTRWLGIKINTDLLWDYQYVVSGSERSVPAKLTNIVE